MTGEVIRTYKSWWYLIGYVWKKGKWVAENPEVGLVLVAKEVDGKITSLTKFRCDKAAEILGAWITPSGNKRKNIKEPKTAAVTCRDKMRICKLFPEEA